MEGTSSTVRRQLPAEAPRPVSSPRSAKSRLVNFVQSLSHPCWHPEHGEGTIHITVDNSRQEYLLKALPLPESGFDFLLTRLPNEVNPKASYEVHLDPYKGDWWCTCLGFVHCGHCKHCGAFGR